MDSTPTPQLNKHRYKRSPHTCLVASFVPRGIGFSLGHLIHFRPTDFARSFGSRETRSNWWPKGRGEGRGSGRAFRCRGRQDWHAIRRTRTLGVLLRGPPVRPLSEVGAAAHLAEGHASQVHCCPGRRSEADGRRRSTKQRATKGRRSG